MIRTIAFDNGGVLTATDTDSSLPTTNGRYTVTSPLAPGATTLLAAIAASPAFAPIQIISKCGPAMATRTLAHFRYQGLFEIALLADDSQPPHYCLEAPHCTGQVHFCARRPDKAAIASRLNVTDMVDDRMSVLRHMSSVKRRYLFRPSTKEMALYVADPQGIILVGSMAVLADHLL